jgi:hypothetical protein
MIKQIEEEGYTILPEGVILSKRKQPMRFSVNHKGYARIGLMLKGKQRFFYLHVIIATKFCKKLPHHTQVNHKDGNKLNNAKDNLEWCTASENILHKYHGDIQGDITLYSKMKELRAIEMTYKQIAQSLNVSVATVFKHCKAGD